MTASGTSGQFSAEDLELLERASGWQHYPDLLNCTPGRLSEVAKTHGLDFATAVLYDRVLQHPVHRSFFERVSAGGESSVTKPLLVGIIPGAFYLEHSNTGADGARIVEIFKSLHCPCELVPVGSFGSLAHNASLIADWLTKHVQNRVMLVSLSKGGADLKMTMSRPDASELFRNVVSWVSLSRLPQGTPLVAWLRGQRLRRLGVRLWLWLHRQRYHVVEELRHESGGPLTGWPAVPSHLRVIHIAGFPLRRHLAHPWAHRAYERLAPLGPNDGGGVLLGSLTMLPGVVFPVWGADHYLQPTWDVVPTFRRILASALSSEDEWRQATRSAKQPINAPASRSTA